MAPIQEFESRDALMAAAADRIEAALRAGLAARGHASAALSGGSTPEPAYRLLAGKSLDWPQITLALVDERWVRPDHPQSNEAMVRRALMKAIGHGARLLPMWSDLPTPQAAAKRADPFYAALSFDIALMGMGEDGHTASWFPAGNGLDAALHGGASVIAVRAPQAAGAADRLTLTRAAVLGAERIVLVISGAAKRAKLEAAARESMEAAPVAALLGSDKLEILWAA